MNQLEFESQYRHSPQSPHKFFSFNLLPSLTSLLPFLRWLPSYSLSNNLSSDITTGLTVGIMVVPQSMAYATLAGVDPVYGLYSCFFPALIYTFFGTSHHVSIGTFAVASMMVGAVQAEFLPEGANDANFTALELTSALTLCVGVCQLVMATLRLSFLTNYISDPLVGGFTTGAAVHVLVSQLDKALGVKVVRQSGWGMIIRMVHQLIEALPSANFWTVGITLFGLTFLWVGRDYASAPFVRKFNLPLPLELVLVIASIGFSKVFNIKEEHGVKIVDHVPNGMPSPSLPRLDLLPQLLPYALSISVICYVFVFSLGKIFAKKHRYRVDSNQELFALSVSQMISSFFPVYPSGASLSRSSLCEMTGAKTPMHALFSSGLLLVVILWLGHMLEPLPMAVLACIVIVSLKGLFLQFAELPRLWRISFYDFAIWLIAFAATVCLDVTSGLAIGLLCVLVSTVLREQWPHFRQLGSTPDGQVFGPVDVYGGLASNGVGRVRVVKFEAPLHFANSSKFISCCTEVMMSMAMTLEGVTVEKELTHLPPLLPSNKGDTLPINHSSPSTVPLLSKSSPSTTNNLANGMVLPPHLKEGVLIVDCGSISHVDSMGIDALVDVYAEGKRCGVRVIYSCLSDSILQVLDRCNLFLTIPKDEAFFPSLQQAVKSLNGNNNE